MGLSKQQEEQAVREWASRLPCPKGLVGVVAREVPDFALHFDDSTLVGMEVTELAHEGQAAGGAVVKALRSDVTQALGRKGIFAAVNLSIPGQYAAVRLTRTRRIDLTDRIVRLVEDHLRQGGAPRWYAGHELQPRGIDVCEAVYVGASDCVQVLSGTHGMGLGNDFVQRRINEKNAKIASYRAAMPGHEQWLLVVSGVRSASGVWWRVMESTVFRSAFDRTFCLDCYNPIAFELRTKPL